MQPSIKRRLISNYEITPFTQPKRKAIEKDLTNHIHKLPSDIWLILLNSLNDETLRNLESTSGTLLDPKVTELTWANRKIIHFLDFNWALCAKEPQRAKCEYRINKAIYKYMLTDNLYMNTDINKQIDIVKNYSNIIERFPFLENLIMSGINQHFNISPTLSKEFKFAYLKQEAGESMLNGLMLDGPVTQEKVFKIVKCFTHAIKKNATCTSLFTSALHPLDQTDLAIEAAKLGDERALWRLSSHNKDVLKPEESELHKTLFSTAWKKIIISIRSQKAEEAAMEIPEALRLLKALKVPLIDNFLGESLGVAANYLANNILLKEELLDESMKAYENNIPLIVYENAASIKYKTEKFQEAEAIYALAMEAYGDNISDTFIGNLGQVKFALGKFKEAEILLDQAIIALEDEITLDLLGDSALTKIKLGKFEEGDKLFDRALLTFGNHFPPLVLANAAFSKLKIEKYDQAEVLYERAVKGFGNNIPDGILENMALTKFKLGKSFDPTNISYSKQ